MSGNEGRASGPPRPNKNIVYDLEEVDQRDNIVKECAPNLTCFTQIIDPPTDRETMVQADSVVPSNGASRWRVVLRHCQSADANHVPFNGPDSCGAADGKLTISTVD